jgi:hypothetical protein
MMRPAPADPAALLPAIAWLKRARRQVAEARDALTAGTAQVDAARDRYASHRADAEAVQKVLQQRIAAAQARAAAQADAAMAELVPLTVAVSPSRPRPGTHPAPSAASGRTG